VQHRGAATVWQVSGARIAAFVGLWLALMIDGLARAETPEVSPGGAIGLGNRGWSAADTNHATSTNELEFSARAGFASDYIYRGTTLSAHGPAAGAAVEATFGPLYAGITVATSSCRPSHSLSSLWRAASARKSQISISISA
jgi:hypothetical protein